MMWASFIFGIFIEPLKDYLSSIAKNGKVKKSKRKSSRFRSVNQCQNGVVQKGKLNVMLTFRSFVRPSVRPYETKGVYIWFYFTKKNVGAIENF